MFAPSPRYAGPPELFELASRLGLRFPSGVKILAVEVAAPRTVGGVMTGAVRAVVAELVARARPRVEIWR